VPVINRLLPHLSGTILRANNDGSVRESLDDGQITRKRFRHELARALRTRDEDPCVLVFIQTEKPSTFARKDNGEPDTEKDLFDVNSFCKKYGDLAGFARTTAISESEGIIALVNFLREGNQKNRASRGLAFITAAPKEKRTDNPVALIESVEDFMSFFTSAESKELQCDVSRISRIDASKFLKQALLKRFELLEASQDPSITFEPQNLLVLSDPCAFLTVTSGGADSGHTFDTRDNTSAFIAGSPSSVRSVIHTHQTSGNEINLYALFPGWHVGQNLSVKEFVLQWLVAFLQVPMTNDGGPWINALAKPILDVSIGGIIAKCTGISAAQEALIKGQCCMLVLPLRSPGGVGNGGGEEEDDAAGSVDGIKAEKWDARLGYHSVNQVMYAYHEHAWQEEGEDGVEVVSAHHGVGPYQAVLTRDGTVLVDCDQIKRRNSGAHPVFYALFDEIYESEVGGMMHVGRLEKEMIVQIATGTSHFLALTAEGRIYAFGTSLQGQMGYLATTTSPVWSLVNINAASLSPELPLAAKVVQVACGANHSLAVVDNGLVYGFGSNSSGQLGLPDTVEAFEASVLLKFERMSSAALLNATGTYVRSDFDTVADTIPWVVSVACGDRHSVFLTASGCVYACGDNSSGQIGYSGTVQDQDSFFETEFERERSHANVDSEQTISTEEVHVGQGGVNTSDILQFQLPVLLEGGHVPATVSMVACGSRHTAVLSHTGRLYVYGGLTQRAPTPPSKARSSGNILWQTVHTNLTSHLEVEAYASALIYHGDPHKIVNISCCGDLTLASYFDDLHMSSHTSPSSLNFSTFWWGQDAASPPAPNLQRAHLQFQLRQSERPQVQADQQANDGEQKGLESGDRVSLDEYHWQLKKELLLCTSSDKTLQRRRSLVPDIMSTTTNPGSHTEKKRIEDMANLINLIQIINRIYMACRSIYPAVREEAVSVWGSPERMVLEAVSVAGFMPATYNTFSAIVTQLLKIENVHPNASKQIITGCQLILYRTTQKRKTLPSADIKHLLSLGVAGIWRPHLLHDRLWDPSDRTSLVPANQSPEPFVLLAEDVLLKKLEAAGGLSDYVDSKIIIEAVKDLLPHPNLAVLFLTRRGNITSGTNVVMNQRLSKEYVIEVRTGDGPNSGTDSHVFFEIVGTHGTSGERALVYSDNANAFESAQTDYFRLSCTELGHIKKVNVRNEGAAAKSKWKLDEIRIWQAANEKLKYDFPFYGWMDARIPVDMMRQELWHDPVDKARERYKYEIKVTTADMPNAGTNASIFITLYGELGDSKRQRLEKDQGGRTFRLFQKRSSENFSVPVASDLGFLTKIVIGTTSWGPRASWRLENVEVTRLRKPANLNSDFTRELSTTKFRNRSGKWIGSDRQSCLMTLFPESDAIRGVHGRIGPPVLTPAEGCFQSVVDVQIAAEDFDGVVLLTVVFVPETERDARVKGNDWQDDCQNSPSGKLENSVELEMEQPDQPKDDRGAPALHATSYYVLPQTVSELSAVSDKVTPVTYRMKANSILKLKRAGGTYRVLTCSVLQAPGGARYSNVTRSGLITIDTDRARAFYQVAIFTGNFPEAGTSANVSLILKGKDGSTTNAHDLTSALLFRPDTSKKAQALLATGQRTMHQMRGLFGRNSEAIFKFEAEDVGEIVEIFIWHDNRALNPLLTPEWYLHRVEVSKNLSSTALGGEHAQAPRVFMCRKWLTSTDTELGTQARLLYSDLHVHEKLIRTYDFAIVVPKSKLEQHQKSLPFDSLVLFGERIEHGVKISLPKSKMERVMTGDKVMYCFQTELKQYLGSLWHAMFTDANGFVAAFKGLRLMVTCYERSAYNTVHFVPSLLDDSFAQQAFASVAAGCTASKWHDTGELKTILCVCDRQLAVEPVGGLDSEQPAEEADDSHSAAVFKLTGPRDRRAKQALPKLKQRANKESSRAIITTLEIWSNILATEEFDEEEALQIMVPACVRLTLVAVAKHGALVPEHLRKLDFVFNQELFPMGLVREIESHSELAIMSSLVADFDKWRRVESTSFELGEIKPANCFAWNLLYWQCCSNPPDPEAISFVMENAGFEKLDDESDYCKYNVSGLEADFALLLHYLVLRQMARYDVIAVEVAQSEAEVRKAAEAIENRAISLKRRLRRNFNVTLRLVAFPVLFVTAAFHILLNMIVTGIYNSFWNYFNDRRMFSQFADTGVLQPSKKESRLVSERWRSTCSGNFNWLNRRWPITQEERRRRDEKHVLVGEWTEFFFELRRQFMMTMVPKLMRISKAMSRWFSIGTTQSSAAHHKSASCRKREMVLEELCRFKPVESHRSKFAIKMFMREAFMSLIILLLLIYTIFQMLGLNLLWDQGSDLYQELRKSLVLNDFDEEHNTFYEIANWEDWWNFAQNSLAPMLTAQQIYRGLDYSGDLRVSPILIRQVRVDADKSGLLPVWGPGPSILREAKAPLDMPMCFNRSSASALQDAHDGCAWSNPHTGSSYLSAYTRGQTQFRSYPSSGYIVQLTKDNVTEKLNELQQAEWFDAATRFVSVETMVYSKSRDRMAYVNLGAEISVTGWASPVVRILTFKPARYGIEHVLYMILFVQSLGNEALNIFDLGPRRYFTNASNVGSLFLASCIFAIFVCQMVIFHYTGQYANGVDDPWNFLSGGATELFNINYILISMVQVQRVCAALSILISILKFLKLFTTVPISGPIGKFLPFAISFCVATLHAHVHARGAYVCLHLSHLVTCTYLF